MSTKTRALDLNPFELVMDHRDVTMILRIEITSDVYG